MSHTMLLRSGPTTSDHPEGRRIGRWSGWIEALVLFVLYELYETGFISYEDALRNADSKNELRLRIKLESKREAKNIDDGGALHIVEEEDAGRSL